MSTNLRMSSSRTPAPPRLPPTAAPSQKTLPSFLPSPLLLPSSYPPFFDLLLQPFGLSQYPRASRGHKEKFAWVKKRLTFAKSFRKSPGCGSDRPLPAGWLGWAWGRHRRLGGDLVQPDLTLRLTKRVLAHTLVRTKVRSGHLDEAQ